MRVVITGASGNVGTALLRVLPAEHDVVGVVRRPPAQQGVYQRADWCSLDLTEHDAIADLRRVFEDARVGVSTHPRHALSDSTGRRWHGRGASGCSCQQRRSAGAYVLGGNLCSRKLWQAGG